MHWTPETEMIIQRNEPLSMYTWFQLGGAAEYFSEPHSQEHLVKLVTECYQNDLPLHILGSGSNILVRDEGVSGLVIRISENLAENVEISGNRVICSGGISLRRLISTVVRAGLAGIEELVGLPGTVGGALRENAGTDSVSIGQFVQKVTLLTPDGSFVTAEAPHFSFGYQQNSLDDGIILQAEFEFHHEDPQELATHMQKLWIMRKSAQPMGHQCAGRIFKDPANYGMKAGELIEMAGLKRTRIGGAVVSDRHANFIISEPECTSSDVLRLIDFLREQVYNRFNINLELELKIW
ncbi:MAG: UDP-N-acetylmuramate dehydrogenase [Planctomycetia bacterium]|nr:UDP-N-acetylmuramate dehydrogenase [Planctomycetia bacterium]